MTGYVDDLPADDHAPVGLSAVMQMWFIDEVVKLVENAVTLVRIDPAQPLDHVVLRSVYQLVVARAEEVLAAAVVAARAAGSTWEQIGSAVRTSKQTSITRYGKTWEEAVSRTWGDSALSPAQWAEMAQGLDEWRAFHEQHRLKTQGSGDDASALVSPGLARMTAGAELRSIEARRQTLFAAAVPDRTDGWQEMVELTQREQAILEVLAQRQAEGGRARGGASYAEQALRASGYAAMLQSRADQAQTATVQRRSK